MISTQSVGAMMLRQPTENNQRRVSKEALCAARARSAVGPANYGTLDLRAAPDLIEGIRLFNQRLSGSWVSADWRGWICRRYVEDFVAGFAFACSCGGIEGPGISAAAEHFNESAPCVSRWGTHKHEQGHVRPCALGRDGPSAVRCPYERHCRNLAGAQLRDDRRFQANPARTRHVLQLRSGCSSRVTTSRAGKERVCLARRIARQSWRNPILFVTAHRTAVPAS